jgi:hypothetical protein
MDVMQQEQQQEHHHPDPQQVAEMAKKILEFIKDYRNVSFAELVRRLDAQGDFRLSFPQNHNLVIWEGVSELFATAFNSIKDRLFEEPCDALIYMMDGMVLNLPIASRLDHTEPHWVPTMLNIRTPEHEKMIAEAKRKQEQRKKRKLSVKEVIAELKKCPKDAFVIIGKFPKQDGRDMTMIDGVKVRNHAVVELVLGEGGYR